MQEPTLSLRKGASERVPLLRMASLQHLKRRSIVPLAALGLLAYYILFLVPLSRRAEGLDAPLQNAWQKLSASLEQTNVVAIDFLHITNQLAETQQSIALLDKAKQKALLRLDLSAAIKAKLSGPFQNVEYQDYRSQQMVEMEKLAKQHQVTLEAGVRAGYPDYSTDIRQPTILWAALSFVDSLLVTALQSNVRVIHSLDVPLTLTNEPSVTTSIAVVEIPLQLEITGSAASVLKLFQNLPLRGDEMRQRGFTDARPDKAPLFVDRFIMRKQAPDKPDELRVSLRVLGYMLRE
jgi:hypothetical protein